MRENIKLLLEIPGDLKKVLDIFISEGKNVKLMEICKELGISSDEAYNLRFRLSNILRTYAIENYFKLNINKSLAEILTFLAKDEKYNL